jgi:L-aminopeptidase/D-esterase-like protein
VILPRGRDTLRLPSFGGWFSMNGNGEMTGTTWVEESGFLEGPVAITNTHSVDTVRDALVAWRAKAEVQSEDFAWWSLPVVAETWDGFLNDINGFHVKERHVFEAMDAARSGAVTEGSVGGGTGMVCYGFKGGIGTSSRRLAADVGGYTVGVLVQANFGRRPQLQVAGVPVGTEITEDEPYALEDVRRRRHGELGSIIIVIATDAPLLPHQLKRLARRASLGMARTGAMSGNGSGDIFIAFSTANPDAGAPTGIATVRALANDDMSRLFDATIYATEEAIVNAIVAGETMTGARGTAIGVPHDRLRAALRKYNRLAGGN